MIMESCQNRFTVEQQQLYESLSEGFNLYSIDLDYVEWLKLYHPESYPSNNLLGSSVQFSDVTPENPVADIDGETMSDTAHTVSQKASSSSNSCSELSQLKSVACNTPQTYMLEHQPPAHPS